MTQEAQELAAWRDMFPRHKFNGERIVPMVMTPVEVDVTTLRDGDMVMGRGYNTGGLYTGRVVGPINAVHNIIPVNKTTEYGHTRIWLTLDTVQLLKFL